VLGEFGGNESARNVEKTSRVAGGPDLSATKADRRRRRIVFPRYGTRAFGGKFIVLYNLKRSS
jgi:hypothetical protein